jgi:hypothetical protein
MLVSEQLHTPADLPPRKDARCPQPVGAKKNLLSVSGIEGQSELAAMPTELSRHLRLAKAEDDKISVRPVEPTYGKWNARSDENDARR